MSNESSSYADWEGEIIELLEDQLDATRSDAQGIVMGQEFAMAQAWGLGLKPAEAAQKVLVAATGQASVISVPHGGPLSVLSAYPPQALVKEFYDSEPEFAEAVASLIGDSFEYPDFSHRKIGDVLARVNAKEAQSRLDAETIAEKKGSYYYVDAKAAQVILGKILGVTASHMVVSVGRAAVILSNADLSHIPAQGQDAKISFKGNGDKGLVVAHGRGTGVANER